MTSRVFGTSRYIKILVTLGMCVTIQLTQMNPIKTHLQNENSKVKVSRKAPLTQDQARILGICTSKIYQTSISILWAGWKKIFILNEQNPLILWYSQSH